MSRARFPGKPGRAPLSVDRLESRVLLSGGFMGSPAAHVAADVAEPNNWQTSAYDLGPVTGTRTVANLTIDNGSDTDWFRFELTAVGGAGHRVSIQSPDTLADLDLDVVDPEGNHLASHGFTSSEQISLFGLPAGVYYAHVYEWSGATVESYSLVVSGPTAPDTLAPTVERAVAQSDQVVVRFQEPMDTLSAVPGTNMVVTDGSGAPVAGTFAWSTDGANLTWTPSAPLAIGAYHLTLSGDGASPLRDRARNALDGDGNGSAGGTFVKDWALPIENTWTLLVFLNADNNLEEAGIDDLNEMESVLLPAGVQIAVEFDRIPGYDTSNENWSDTRRGIVTHDTDPLNLSTPLVSIGERDMGSLAELSDFLAWGIANAPADRYALVIWDHGNGLEGVSYDSTSGNNLSTRNVRDAVAGAPDRIDIVGFDGCLMGITELAFEFRDLSDVFVAAEKTIPWDGWGYQFFLSDLAANPNMTPAQLGTSMVEGYGDLYGNRETLSAIDLSKMNALRNALDQIAVTCSTGSTSDWLAVDQAINAATDFYGALGPDYRDLGQFLAGLAASNASVSIRTAAVSALSVYEDAVIALHSGSFERATGLTILLPGPGESLPDFYAPAAFEFLRLSKWNAFLLRQPVQLTDTTAPVILGMTNDRRNVYITFSEPIDTTRVSYGVDVFVTDASGAPVANPAGYNPLRWRSGGTVLQWRYDQPSLPAGTYTITLVSQSTANFVDYSDNPLDGDGNGEPGGDFVRTLTVGDVRALTMVSSLTIDGITITAYDTQVIDPAQSSIQLATQAGFDRRVTDVLVVDRRPGDGLIDALYFYDDAAGLGLSIEGGQGTRIGQIVDRRSSGDRLPIAFIASAIPVGSLQIAGAVTGFDLNGAALGQGWVLPSDPDEDSDTLDETALYLPESRLSRLAVAAACSGDVVILGAGTVALESMLQAADFVAAESVEALAIGSLAGKSADPAAVRIGGPIVRIAIGRADQSKIEAESAGSVMIAGRFAGNMAFDGDVGLISIKGDAALGLEVSGNLGTLTAAGGDLSGLVEIDGRLGALTLPRGSLLAPLGADSIGTLDISGGSLAAPLATFAGGIDRLNVKGGSVAAPLTLAGNLGRLAITGGGLGAALTARDADSILITGGDADFRAGRALRISGRLGQMSVRSGSVLGDLTIGSLGRLSITGGNFDARLSADRMDALRIAGDRRTGGGSIEGLLDISGALGTVDMLGGTFGAQVRAESIRAILARSQAGSGGNVIGANVQVASGGTLERVSVGGSMERTSISAGAIGRLDVRRALLGDPSGLTGPFDIVARRSFTASAANLPRQTIGTDLVEVDNGRVRLYVQA